MPTTARVPLTPTTLSLLPVLLLLGPVPAAAAADPHWTFAPSGDGRPACYAEGPPGAVLRDTATLTNPVTHPVTVRLCATGAARVTLAETGVRVPARTRAEIPFTMTVPADTAPGARRATITARDGNGGTRSVPVWLRVTGPALAALTVERVRVRPDRGGDARGDDPGDPGRRRPRHPDPADRDAYGDAHGDAHTDADRDPIADRRQRRADRLHRRRGPGPVQVPYECKTPIGDRSATSPVRIDARKDGGSFALTVRFGASVMDSPGEIPADSVKPSMEVVLGGAGRGTVHVEGPTNAEAVKAGDPIEIPDLTGTYKPGASGRSTLSPGVLTVEALGTTTTCIPGRHDVSLTLDTTEQAGGASGGSAGSGSAGGSTGGGSAVSGGGLAETGAGDHAALKALALVAGTVLLLGGAIFTFLPGRRAR
uniref:COG1470 family protein n=1 Tax=Streptomyces broussonetiae TaxID=2686304 RepID=UPI0035E2D54D